MSKINNFLTKIKARIPSREKLFQSKWLRPLEPYFNKSYYWSFRRKNVAKAVAIGMFCGLMPGPTQMLAAFFLAYLLRTNISIAVFTTLYSNPITFIPLYYVAYKIGVFVQHGTNPPDNVLSMQTMSSWDWDLIMTWITKNLTYLFVGVPTLGLILALIAYYLILILGRLHIMHKIKLRLERHKNNKA